MIANEVLVYGVYFSILQYFSILEYLPRNMGRGNRLDTVLYGQLSELIMCSAGSVLVEFKIENKFESSVGGSVEPVEATLKSFYGSSLFAAAGKGPANARGPPSRSKAEPTPAPARLKRARGTIGAF